jgi:hypothetical protein
MTNLNNDFYSFYRGNIWKHNKLATHNNFYGNQYSSSITLIFNDSPSENKMFKTAKIEGSSPWSASYSSPISSGSLPASNFKKKESYYYANLIRNAGNLDTVFLSAQGIGTVISGSLNPGYVDIFIAGNVGNTISLYYLDPTFGEQGDLVFSMNTSTGVKTLCGIASQVQYDKATNRTRIRLVAANGILVLPNVSDYMIFIKNSQAESPGIRGYYMQMTLTNTDTTEAELFEVSSEVFKSYP